MCEWESIIHPCKVYTSLKLPTGSIIALKEPVMEVVILIRLEVILPAAVRGCGADQEMNSIPPWRSFELFERLFFGYMKAKGVV